jgi:hypothetical protein
MRLVASATLLNQRCDSPYDAEAAYARAHCTFETFIYAEGPQLDRDGVPQFVKVQSPKPCALARGLDDLGVETLGVDLAVVAELVVSYLTIHFYNGVVIGDSQGRPGTGWKDPGHCIILKLDVEN